MLILNGKLFISFFQPPRSFCMCVYLDGIVACRRLSMPCHWASANLDLSLSMTEQSSQKHITCTASEGKKVQRNKDYNSFWHIYLLHLLSQETLPSTCKTLLSDSSPVLTSTFSKMHFLAVALVYAAADSSKDSDTLFTGEIKHKGNKLAPRSSCQCLVT